MFNSLDSFSGSTTYRTSETPSAGVHGAGDGSSSTTISRTAGAAVLLVVAGTDGISPLFQPANCPLSTLTTRQFIERAMRENHGYTVPERWLADLDAIPDGDTGEPQSGYLVGTDTPTTQERALLRKLAEEFGDGPTTANPQEDEG
jgi:hypothetical protein